MLSTFVRSVYWRFPFTSLSEAHQFYENDLFFSLSLLSQCMCFPLLLNAIKIMKKIIIPWNTQFLVYSRPSNLYLNLQRISSLIQHCSSKNFVTETKGLSYFYPFPKKHSISFIVRQHRSRINKAATCNVSLNDI